VFLPMSSERTSQGLSEAIAVLVGGPLDRSPVVPDGWTTGFAARRIA
jgi:hypothetical protein